MTLLRIVALALFGSTATSDEMIESLSLGKVTVLYIGVGLLFLFAALLIPNLLTGMEWRFLYLLGALFLAAFAARALVLFGLLLFRGFVVASPAPPPFSRLLAGSLTFPFFSSVSSLSVPS